MNLSSLLSPILTFIQTTFLYLSRVDGKEGLTVDDFNTVVAYAKSVSELFGATSSNEVKATAVITFINKHYGARIPTWLSSVMAAFAYLYAKRKGLV